MKPRISEIFASTCSLDFLSGAIQVIEGAYLSGREAASGLSKFVQPLVGGVHRWGMIETHVKDLADLHGISSDWVPNSSKSAFHVEIRVGNFLIIVARSDERGKLPEDAEYRRTLIDASQLRLFPAEASKGDHVLAIITHGPSDNLTRVGYVEVLFPDSDGQIVDRLDLNSIASASVPKPIIEQVHDASLPALRELKVPEPEVVTDTTNLRLREERRAGTTDTP